MLLHGGVRQVVIGHDFRAGYRGEASAEWFQREGQRLGLAVEVQAPVMVAGLRVGSGAIRTALAGNDLQTAARLLGRPYTMRGRVIAGRSARPPVRVSHREPAAGATPQVKWILLECL